MNKLKYWLIPALIVILAIGAIVFIRGRAPEIEPSEIAEEEKKPMGFAEPKEPSQHEKAEEDATAMGSALRSGNLEDCEAITWDLEMKQKCLDNLLYSKALRDGDESTCKQIQNESLRQDCLSKVFLDAAMNSYDLSLCDKIEDLEVQQECKDGINSFLLRKATSVEDCTNINSEKLRTECENKVSLNVAIKENNVDACENIKDEALKAECIGNVEINIEVSETNQEAIETVKTETKTTEEFITVCDSLIGDAQAECKDMLYPQMAIEKMDISYCDLISNPDLINECKLNLTQSLDQYYLREAISTGDASLCDKISSTQVQNTCKSSL